MGILSKLKLWEVLLLIVVCLLASLAYEAHKTNRKGRFVLINKEPLQLLDSETGDYWFYMPQVIENSAFTDPLQGSGHLESYMWEKFIPGPGFGVPDTFEVLDKKPVNQNN